MVGMSANIVQIRYSGICSVRNLLWWLLLLS